MKRQALSRERLVSVHAVVCVAVVVSLIAPSSRAASPQRADRLRDAAVTVTGPHGQLTPVVNEGLQLQLKVKNVSGGAVTAQSWSTDSPTIVSVDSSGLLHGIKQGFATITAHTAQGDGSAIVAVVRKGTRHGRQSRGDAKTDTGGHIYISDPRHDVIVKSTGTLDTDFAGQRDTAGFVDGQGSAARFNGPTGLGVDNSAVGGGVYVADEINNSIRQVSFRGANVTTVLNQSGVAQTMTASEADLDAATFNGPRGVASNGRNLFIADTNSHAIWYASFQKKKVFLIAGQPGVPGSRDGEGQNAQFNMPTGIAINSEHTLVAVADTGNRVVRVIKLVETGDGGFTGDVTTLGVRSSARGAEMSKLWGTDDAADAIPFVSPESVSFDGVGNVYVIDAGDGTIANPPSASVITMPQGELPQKVELAQEGTLGMPASVVNKGTSTLVLDEAATTPDEAIEEITVGAPAIASVTPDADVLEGGATVQIGGANFAPESILTLGDAEVTQFQVVSATRITFVVPAQSAPGSRTLTVATRGGVAQHDFNIGPKALTDLADGEITTVVGGLSYLGDGGLAVPATLSGEAVALDGQGNLFVADYFNQRVRRIDAQTGIISTVAGNGVQGFSGDGHQATTARLNNPSGVAVDASSNVFIADRDNHRIRRVDATTGIITTYAGTGVQGFNGDNRPATDAQLNLNGRAFDNSLPGLAVDADGNLLICDVANYRIRRVDAATGAITTVAGNGTSGFSGDNGSAKRAMIGEAYAVTTDAAGNIFIADSTNHRIRRVDTAGIITTVAGKTIKRGKFIGDGREATKAGLYLPRGIAVDAVGRLYIGDSRHFRIRVVDPDTHIISTLAGAGGDDGDDIPASSANLAGAAGLALDAAGNLFVAPGIRYTNETRSMGIRRIDAATGIISTVAGNGTGSLGDFTGIDVDSAGNVFFVADKRIYRKDAQTNTITVVAGGGSSGDDNIPATSAGFQDIFGFAVDASDNVFIADYWNRRVRLVDAQTGTITTYAGGGNGGDGGPAAGAELGGAIGVAFDVSGDLLIATGPGDNRIRRVNVQTRTISTVAGMVNTSGFRGDHGPATSARLNEPHDIAVDAAGNVFIADSLNGRIRKVDTAGIITTYAGGGHRSDDNVLATQASLSYVQGIVVDAAGNLFIADTVNNRVRRVDVNTQMITTVAGTGDAAYTGDNGPARSASLNGPAGIGFDASGNLFIVDLNNNVIRVVRGVGQMRGARLSR